MSHESLQPKKSATLEGKGFEGIVQVPQAYGGAVIENLAHIFSTENPEHEMEKLVAPIPIDEVLIQRTYKANKQHEYHGIKKVIEPDDTRAMLIKGNIATLNYLRTILRVNESFDDSFTVREGSKWTNSSILQNFEAIQENITPENSTFLGQIFTVIDDVLRSPEVTILLKNRKELLSQKSANFQPKLIHEINSQIDALISNRCAEFLAEQNLAIEELKLAERIMERKFFS